MVRSIEKRFIESNENYKMTTKTNITKGIESGLFFVSKNADDHDISMVEKWYEEKILVLLKYGGSRGLIAENLDKFLLSLHIDYIVLIITEKEYCLRQSGNCNAYMLHNGHITDLSAELNSSGKSKNNIHSIDGMLMGSEKFLLIPGDKIDKKIAEDLLRSMNDDRHKEQSNKQIIDKMVKQNLISGGYLISFKKSNGIQFSPLLLVVGIVTFAVVFLLLTVVQGIVNHNNPSPAETENIAHAAETNNNVNAKTPSPIRYSPGPNRANQGNKTPAPTQKSVSYTYPPLSQPTVKPTVRPTARPTVKKTVKPTAKPTVKPTARPTAKPTVKPTEKPVTTPVPAQT